MAAKKLENMSDDELMDNWTVAAEELEAAKEKVKAFSQEHQRRETEANAARILEGMTDVERAALAQMVGPVGVESSEKYGSDK